MDGPPGGEVLREGARLLDDATLRTLADPSTTLTDLDLDDEETRKRLLREVKRLAFSPATNPDTRLSATQVWLKLKDMAKSRDLGPGKPLTRAAAIERLVSLLRTVGPDISIAAMYKAFNVKETPDAQTEADQAPTPSGTPEAPLSTGHESQVTPAVSLRPEHVDGGLQQLDFFRDDHRRDDLPRPEEGWPDPPRDPRATPCLDGGTLPAS